MGLLGHGMGRRVLVLIMGQGQRTAGQNVNSSEAEEFPSLTAEIAVWEDDGKKPSV